MTELKRTLTARLKAGFTWVSIDTHEEYRALEHVAAACRAAARLLFVWSITRGLLQIDPETGIESAPEGIAASDPIALAALLGSEQLPERSVVVSLDAAGFLRAKPQVPRAHRDAHLAMKARQVTHVWLGVRQEFPPSIDRQVAKLAFLPPSESERAGLIEAMVESASSSIDVSLDEDQTARLISGLSGLGRDEAEDALALTMAQDRRFDLQTVTRLKGELLKASNGAVTMMAHPDNGQEAIGGFEAVKAYVRRAVLSFSAAARRLGRALRKGVVLAGQAGTGKTVLAKATAAAMELPLYRWDVSAVMGGIVGESQKNMRECTRVLDALAPCVVLIDELEKLVPASNGERDGGSSSQVKALLLSWLQDRESAVYLIATCNRPAELDAEILRAGRFDRVFWADLPGPRVRREIFAVHTARHGVQVDLDAAVEASRQFVGAEIEQAVIEATYLALAEGEDTAVTEAHLLAAVGEIVPNAVLAAERVDALRAWAKAHQAYPVDEPDPEPGPAKRATKGRRVS